MRMRRLAWVGVAAMAGFGCAAPEDEATAGPEVWRVADEPTLTIGELDGDSAYLFQSISDARFLPDGRIVVADRGLTVVRTFDADGRFLVQIGRRGEGPGEFRSIRGLWVIPPDTVAIWDSRSRRVTYFGAGGALAGTVQIEASDESAGVGSLDFLAGAFADGSFALGSIALGGYAPGSAPDPVSIEHFDRSGVHLGRLGETTGLARAALSENLRGPVAFSPYPRFAWDGDVIYHTDGYRPHVVVVGPRTGGRTLDLPASAHDVDAAYAALEARIRERGSEMHVGALPTAPRPDSIPQVGGLLVDDTGRVWAKRYDPSTDGLWLGGNRPAGGTWWVVEAGTVVAEARLPTSFTPHHVQDDRILGLSVDELGIERVEVRVIER